MFNGKSFSLNMGGKHELQVTSCQFRHRNYEFTSASYEVKSTSYEFQFTSYDFKPRVRKLKARVSSNINEVIRPVLNFIFS